MLLLWLMLGLRELIREKIENIGNGRLKLNTYGKTKALGVIPEGF